IVYLVELASEALPWGFFNFTSPPSPQLATRGTASGHSFTGPGVWTSTDDNADGLYDALVWSGSVSVSGPTDSQRLGVVGGVFSDTVLVLSRASDSRAMPSSDTLSISSSGTFPVSLRFSGEDLRSSGASGVLLGRLSLIDATGTVLDTLTSPT